MAAIAADVAVDAPVPVHAPVVPAPAREADDRIPTPSEIETMKSRF